MCFIETLVLASTVSETLAQIDHQGPNRTLKMTFRAIPPLSYFRIGLISQLYPRLFLIDFSCELGIMTSYDFLDARFVILMNVWKDAHWTYFHFWSTSFNFTTATLPKIIFYQLLMWIWVNNDQIWLFRVQMYDIELCSNHLQLYIISLLVHFL